jgi:hypothetical protein
LLIYKFFHAYTHAYTYMCIHICIPCGQTKNRAEFAHIQIYSYTLTWIHMSVYIYVYLPCSQTKHLDMCRSKFPNNIWISELNSDIYVLSYTHTHVHIFVYIFTRTRVCIHAYIPCNQTKDLVICWYINIFLYTHTYRHICVYTYMYTLQSNEKSWDTCWPTLSFAIECSLCDITQWLSQTWRFSFICDMTHPLP